MSSHVAPTRLEDASGPDAPETMLARCQDLYERAQQFDSPEEPLIDASLRIGWLTRPPPGEHRHVWVAYLDDEAVGAAWMGWSDLGACSAGLCVVPEARQRGAGSTLLQALVDMARGQDLPALFGTCTRDEHVAFLVQHGAVVVQTEWRQALRLPLPDLSPGELPQGIDAENWEGSVPEALVASYVATLDQIADAPGDEDEHDNWTVERLLRYQAVARARDEMLRYAVLIEAGEVVALSELSVPGRHGGTASTRDTVVRRTHRGRGLALPLKQRAIEALTRARPDVRTVITTNATSNAPMLAVNAALGFERVALKHRIRLDAT